MSETRTAWHPGFFRLLEFDKPDFFSLVEESVLTTKQQADVVIVRKESGWKPTRGLLAPLWAVLPKHSVIEYKSRHDPPRAGVLSQLFAYGHIVDRLKREEVPDIEDLALVLVTASTTPTVESELRRYERELDLEHCGKGLYRVHGPLIATWLYLLNEGAEEPGASMLGWFGSKALKPSRKTTKLGSMEITWQIRAYRSFQASKR